MKQMILVAMVAALASAGLLISGCGGGGGGSDGQTLPESVTFSVRNGVGVPVASATVYLVPSSAIDDTAFDGQDVLDGTSEDYDEPLEDAIRLHGASFPQAVTDASGQATVSSVPSGSYFWFVMPDAGDTETLPGGLGCRDARSTTTFLGTTVDIEVSSSPSAASTYMGTSTCLVCHPAYVTQTQHAHRLGFGVPGQLGPLQDDQRYPAYQEGWDAFVSAADYTGGTPLWFSDFDPSRGFDKFKTSLTDPSLPPRNETVNVKAYLWKDQADGKSKITLVNMQTPADPKSPWTLTVALTYGGAVFKQRNLVEIPGRKGHYPLLQIQTDGDDTRYDRTRRKYRDYHLDFFWDGTNSVFKDPAVTKAFEGNCTGCHSTGFERYQDPQTLEWLTRAVDDIGGAFNIDDDPSPDEINLGCEVCHGPGSDHVAWAGNPANAGVAARFIVQPERLSPSREMLICGRCHDRVEGNGPVPNDEPLNPAGRMPPVGIGRTEYLANYVTRNGPKTSSYWSDLNHSKSHHQQYTDMLKSEMHRNGRIIAVCTDCHDSHATSPFRHHLTADPDNPNSLLCASCHDTDLMEHMQQETGATHAGNQTTCVKCHMTKAAKSGAGRFGILIGNPTGGSADPTLTYFQNDITSHLFGHQPPKKTHQDVSGVAPGSAMPIPYTLSCGAPCHQVGQLQFQTPIPEALRTALNTISEQEEDDYGTNK